MKKTLAIMTLATSFSMADFIGGELNVGYYNHAPSGTVQYLGTPIDIENDLKWKDKGDLFLKAYFEHPLPILPNIKVGYTEFGHNGAGVISQGFTFAGQTYAINSNIDSAFDLKMYDLTLYYELLDNWINLDAGVNVKYVDGVISVKNNIGLSESKAFQAPVPMLYTKARFDVPTTDLSFQVEGNYISYSGNTLYDAEAGVRYTLALGLGVEAGYKTMKLKLDNVNDVSLDSDFSGVYGKLVWDF
jgi:outer membrane protein